MQASFATTVDVYHGTSAPFDAFRLAHCDPHNAQSGLGFFCAVERGHAARFGSHIAQISITSNETNTVELTTNTLWAFASEGFEACVVRRRNWTLEGVQLARVCTDGFVSEWIVIDPRVVTAYCWL